MLHLTQANNRNIQITLSPFSPGSPEFPETPWKNKTKKPTRRLASQPRVHSRDDRVELGSPGPGGLHVHLHVSLLEDASITWTGH